MFTFLSKIDTVMNKLITLLLLCLPLVTLAQSYDALVDDTKMWSTRYDQLTCPQGLFSRYFRIGDDTLAGSVACKKLEIASDSLHMQWSSEGLIYESNRKVFYRYFDYAVDSVWYPLYDFSLQVGDTFVLNQWISLVTDSIDSVYIAGKYRDRYFMQYMGSPAEVWIEGMGCLNGLMEAGSSALVGTISQLLCYYEAEVLLYNNPDYAECYYADYGIAARDQALAYIHVYPNPVRNRLTFENKDASPVEVVIRNAQGAVVRRTGPLNGPRPELQLEGMPAGLYFLMVYGSDGLCGRATFVKD